MNEPMARLEPPRLVYRIGVVGHRWNKLGGSCGWQAEPDGLERSRAIEAEMTATVRRVLRSIRKMAEEIGGKPRSGYRSCSGQAGDFTVELVVVSAVAEGADRIVANAGLAEGYVLDVLLPFAAGEYRKDFDEQWKPKSWSRPEAAGEFDRLISVARRTVTTDGVLGRSDRYGPLSRAVVEQSDLVVGIWDREASDGIGGTADALAVARRHEVPIVRIDCTRAGDRVARGSGSQR